MRIITGKLGGRVFNDAPMFTYNPMSEKMRGSLFNTMGDIEGLTVLDPFGGTGALSYEAVSRGAASSVLIEKDKRAYENIQKNIEILDIKNEVKAIRANSAGWSDNNAEIKFDLLLMDPPYDNIKFSLIEKLIARHIKKGGLAVLSFPGRISARPFDDTETLVLKQFGDGQLAFYRKTK